MGNMDTELMKWDIQNEMEFGYQNVSNRIP